MRFRWVVFRSNIYFDLFCTSHPVCNDILPQVYHERLVTRTPEVCLGNQSSLPNELECFCTFLFVRAIRSIKYMEQQSLNYDTCQYYDLFAYVRMHTPIHKQGTNHTCLFTFRVHKLSSFRLLYPRVVNTLAQRMRK